MTCRTRTEATTSQRRWTAREEGEEATFMPLALALAFRGALRERAIGVGEREGIKDVLERRVWLYWAGVASGRSGRSSAASDELRTACTQLACVADLPPALVSGNETLALQSCCLSMTAALVGSRIIQPSKLQRPLSVDLSTSQLRHGQLGSHLSRSCADWGGCGLETRTLLGATLGVSGNRMVGAGRRPGVGLG